MTAPHIVDPAGLLAEALTDASPDLMRSLLQTMINQLLSTDADAVCGAEWRPSVDRREGQDGLRSRGAGDPGSPVPDQRQRTGRGRSLSGLVIVGGTV